MHTSDLIILLILLGCMATYIPVFMCLFFTAVLGLLFFTDIPILLLAQSIFRSMDNFALVVVLFFILCGNIMTAGSIVEKLIKFANALVSWLPGGLGMAGVLACGMFGAISGSTVATVVALGGFMIPQLIKKGYPEKYSIGLMTTSPNLGVIIPPSIGMILYSMISNVSLEGLFATGFIPGVLIMLIVCVYTYFIFRGDAEIVSQPVPSIGQVWKVFKECFWALMLPVSVPSHSSLMKPAADELAGYLKGVTINKPKTQVIHNVDARSHDDPDAIREALVKQLYNPVQWTHTVQIISDGADAVIECGPGKVLSGLTRRINADVKSYALDSIKSMDRFLDSMSGEID